MGEVCRACIVLLADTTTGAKACDVDTLASCAWAFNPKDESAAQAAAATVVRTPNAEGVEFKKAMMRTAEKTPEPASPQPMGNYARCGQSRHTPFVGRYPGWAV
jgi:hypothetical protein